MWLGWEDEDKGDQRANNNNEGSKSDWLVSGAGAKEKDNE